MTKRVFVEDCAVLDVADVPIPQPEPLPLNLPGAGPAIPKSLDSGLSVIVTSTWADGQETTTTVGITATYPHFGGVRFWLLCECGRRSGKLYGTLQDKKYSCRLCRNLVYRSQYLKSPRSLGFR